MNKPIHPFGAWIKLRRRSLDLTQHALAQQVGCSVIMIQKLEAGRRRPSQQIAERLARYLQLSADEQQPFIQLGRGLQRDPGTAQQASLHTIAGVPRPLTPLIGRDHDLALLAALLRRRDARLISCVGPGGVGKTRLVLELPARLEGVFEDIAFVPLAPLRDAHFLLAVIGHALGMTIRSAAPLDELVAQLRGREQLLILDNCVTASVRHCSMLNARFTLV